jgi:signal transduction histidine kinase
MLASGQLYDDAPTNLKNNAGDVHQLARRIAHELELQRRIALGRWSELRSEPIPVRLSSCIDDLRRLVNNHPTAAKKRIDYTCQAPENFRFNTDPAMLQRVLGNMAINALEATLSGGEIKVNARTAPAEIVFSVWNSAAIPPNIALRIFQRNFTTKESLGRGLGTYSMKLIGEQMLGGKVVFESNPETGTTFRFSHPL